MARANRTAVDSFSRQPRSTRFGVGRILHWHLALLRTFSARIRQRRMLNDLDDRMLRDIGVTRSMAQREIDKPFWRS